MTQDSNAIAHEETPHATENTTEATPITISDALRRRAQAAINDPLIDPQRR
jgi:hypothetical protein